MIKLLPEIINIIFSYLLVFPFRDKYILFIMNPNDIANAITIHNLKLKLAKINNNSCLANEIVPIVQAYDDITFVLYNNKWYMFDDLARKFDGFFELLNTKNVEPFEDYKFVIDGTPFIEENAVKLSDKVVDLLYAWSLLKENNLL